MNQQQIQILTNSYILKKAQKKRNINGVNMS